ncbi:MAG: hypothetical protein E7043_03200 [Lentisphaerae bacterium]|nr:hypothetical protein [Lentisphaerota bacterium]MBE6389161.1 hypothetical protein [Lentisphaerota bacterium]
MQKKAFPESNLPPNIQEKADRMNLEESCVPAFEILPLPFSADTPAVQKNISRRKTLEIFTKELYGEIPPRCQELKFVLRSSGSVFNGLAERREIDIVCTNNGISRTLHMLLYLPVNRQGKVPCFLGLNFTGNHATVSDPEVTFFPFVRKTHPSPWLNDGRAEEDQRGTKAGRWEFERVIKAGFASATICMFDAFPDFPEGFSESIMPLFYPESLWNSSQRPSGAISAWAWGLMRGIDALESQADIDPHKIIVHGLSRQGKTAIWAGANDPRIAMTVSICSGTCGAKMSRRYFGENMEWLDQWRKYWFVPSFENFVHKDTVMPFDQHQLMALIAPRILYVASASNDPYADPAGEHLATVTASAAWGENGLPADAAFPESSGGQGENAVRYYLREGEHACTPENWDDLLKFAAKHFFEK